LIERAGVAPNINADSMLVGEVCFSDGNRDLPSRGLSAVVVDRPNLFPRGAAGRDPGTTLEIADLLEDV
jgi:hypothetical protein